MGGWCELLAALRLSVSPPRIGLALAGVLVSWILAACIDRLWAWCGVSQLMSRFAATPFAGWPAIARTAPCFTVVVGVLWLTLWALLGSAVCRGHAVAFGAGQPTGWGRMLTFGRRHWGAAMRAVFVPIVVVAPFAVVCLVNGLILRIPWVGDIVGGLMLGMSLVAGMVIAYLGILWCLSAGLYWPAIAADGFQAAEGVARCAAYVQARLVRTVGLMAVAVVLVIVGWFAAVALAGLGVHATRTLLRAAAVPWSGDGATRLDLLWPLGDTGQWYAWAGNLPSARYRIAHALLGGWIWMLRAVIWAWLINLFFAVTTVVYFLLRADVDDVAHDDVFGIHGDPTAPGSTGRSSEAWA